MQHTTVLDTHEAVTQVKGAGADERLAEAIVSTCSAAAVPRLEALATTADLAELRANLAESLADLRTEIVYVCTRFSSLGAVLLAAAIVKALDFLVCARLRRREESVGRETTRTSDRVRPCRRTRLFLLAVFAALLAITPAAAQTGT